MCSNIHLNESLMPKWVILKHKYFCVWESFPRDKYTQNGSCVSNE